MFYMLVQGIASKQSFLRLPTVLIQVIRDFNLLKKTTCCHSSLLMFIVSLVQRASPGVYFWKMLVKVTTTTLMVDLFVPCLHQWIAYQRYPEVCNRGLGRARREPGQCNNHHLNEMMPWLRWEQIKITNEQTTKGGNLMKQWKGHDEEERAKEQIEQSLLIFPCQVIHRFNVIKIALRVFSALNFCFVSLTKSSKFIQHVIKVLCARLLEMS